MNEIYYRGNLKKNICVFLVIIINKNKIKIVEVYCKINLIICEVWYYMIK